MPDILSKNNSNSKRRRYIKSSSFIMALLFTILCGLAALSIAYYINYFTKGHFAHTTEAVLNTEIKYIQAVGIENAEKTDQLYILLNDDGSLPPEFSSNISRLVEGIIVFDNTIDNKKYAAKIHTLPNNQKILIGTDITDVSKDFKFMQWIGIISIFFVIAVVSVSYLISFFVVDGTNKIADTAREIINTGDLSRRVDFGGRWDDLSNMAMVLNLLLDRVEQLMQGVKQVSDNIAHDLRTPLTRIRSTIESLHDDGHKAQLQEEADQLLKTFNALLRISRIEAERQRSQFRKVNLKELIDDVISFYEPLAEEQSIQIDGILREASINGDRDLLFQAYANLLDNAIKHTPSGGKITVEIVVKNGRNHIEISDTGGGVKDEEINKIFNRFYRGDKSRRSSGTGLGLSLVQAVIERHDGDIKAVNSALGLRIITIL